jgi:hypothetical protein
MIQNFLDYLQLNYLIPGLCKEVYQTKTLIYKKKLGLHIFSQKKLNTYLTS